MTLIWPLGSCRSCWSIEKCISHYSSVFSVSFEDGNFRPPLDRAEILSAHSYLVVLQLGRSDCSTVTGTLRYRPRIVTAVCEFFRFLVLCCIAIWLVIEHNLCCDLRLSCNHNFDHSGILIDWLVPVVFTSHIENVFHVKIPVSSWSVFVLLPLFAIAPHRFLQVREIVIRCLLLLLRYYCYCVEFPIRSLLKHNNNINLASNT